MFCFALKTVKPFKFEILEKLGRYVSLCNIK